MDNIGLERNHNGIVQELVYLGLNMRLCEWSSLGVWIMGIWEKPRPKTLSKRGLIETILANPEKLGINKSWINKSSIRGVEGFTNRLQKK